MKKKTTKKPSISKSEIEFKEKALKNARAYAKNLVTVAKKKNSFKSVFDSCPTSRLNKAISDLL